MVCRKLCNKTTLNLAHWFGEISSEFLPELRDVIRIRLKDYVTSLLSDEDPKRVVEQLERGWIKSKAIREFLRKEKECRECRKIGQLIEVNREAS